MALRLNLRDILFAVMTLRAVFGMDGQTTGLGLMDFDVNDPDSLLYTDKSKLPSQIQGMSHELKNLIKCVDMYHRRTPVHEQAIIEVNHPTKIKPCHEPSIPSAPAQVPAVFGRVQ
jgi:hypothetical protein